MISPPSETTGRGGRVLVREQNDLASDSSSAAIELIHDGLRCLEHRESVAADPGRRMPRASSSS